MINFISSLINRDLNNQVMDLNSYENISMIDYIKIIALFLNKGVAVEEGEPYWAPAFNLDVNNNEYSKYFDKVENKLSNFYKWYKEIGELKYGYREETI